MLVLQIATARLTWLLLLYVPRIASSRLDTDGERCKASAFHSLGSGTANLSSAEQSFGVDHHSDRG